MAKPVTNPLGTTGGEKKDVKPDEKQLIREYYFKKWLSEFEEEISLNEIYGKHFSYDETRMLNFFDRGDAYAA